MKASLKFAGATLAAAMLSASAVHAAAVAGTYKTITIDGNFSDWDSVPVAATSPVSGAPIDFTQLKIANDSTNVYFLLTFATSVNPQSGSGVFTAVDSDNNGSTGFNIFGNPTIGSNFGFQNDFPFTQTASNFNSGGTTANTTYAASPYNTPTTMQEIAVPLTASQVDTSTGGYTGLIFPSTFTVEFYTTESTTDTIGPVTYTQAAVPEPVAISLLGISAVPLLRRRATRTTK